MLGAEPRAGLAFAAPSLCCPNKC